MDKESGAKSKGKTIGSTQRKMMARKTKKQLCATAFYVPLAKPAYTSSTFVPIYRYTQSSIKPAIAQACRLRTMRKVKRGLCAEQL